MGTIKSLFGRRAQRATGGPKYSRLFKPSTHPARVRLVPGKYVHPDGDIYEVGFSVNHYVPKVRKSFLCSSTWTVENGVYSPKGKCVGCYIYAQNLSGVGEYAKLKISRAFHYPVTVIVLEDFHLDPTGWDGQPLGYNDQGEPMYRKVMCTGEGCSGCEKNLKKTFGRRMIWELNETQLQALDKAADAHKDYCANCGTRGLEVDDVVCPECGDSFPFVPPEGKVVTCPSCGKPVTPNVILECRGCDNPRRPTIFDCVFTVSALKEGKGFPIFTVSRTDVGPLSTLGFEIPDQWLEPIDFDALYRPLPLEAQAQLIGIPNPFDSEETFEYKKEEAPF